MDFTLEEFKKRFSAIAEQANTDGNYEIASFFYNLLNKSSVDEKIYKSLFDFADSMDEKDVCVFDCLLGLNATVDWFDFAEFIADQRGNLSNYKDIIAAAFHAGIDCEELKNIEKDTSGLNDFKEKVNELINSEINQSVVSNVDLDSDKQLSHLEVESEFIQHLKAENAQLNSRLDETLKELNTYRDEQKRIMETSFESKHKVMQSKMDVDRLNKDLQRSKVMYSILEKKYAFQKNMIVQLQNINHSIVKENNDLKEEFQSIDSLKALHAEEISSYKSDCIEKQARIESLEQELVLLKDNLRETEKRLNDLSINGISEDAQNLSDFHTVEHPSNNDNYDKFIISPKKDDNNLLDYNDEDLIAITNNEDTVRKHSNIFSNLLGKFFKKRFEDSTSEDQYNRIVTKILQNEYKTDAIYKIANRVSKESSDESRIKLYELVCKKTPEDEIINVFKMSNLSA